MCFKSELHLSQDGVKMPIARLWQQLIAEVKPRLVITTGTAGGIGAGVELGDVVVAKSVRFDCMKEFKSKPFHAASYDCSLLTTGSFAVAQELFSEYAGHLPTASRPPAIFAAASADVPLPDIVTTDFFAFDDTSNTFDLQSLGGAVEMGDAVLGLVTQELGATAPLWIAVRNASDPEIDSTGLTEKEAATKAAQIYECTDIGPQSPARSPVGR
jgi:purine-nucleoside phosphorylase